MTRRDSTNRARDARPDLASTLVFAAALGFLVAALPSLALALDQPISGKLLKIKPTSEGVEVTFVSTDPAVPFPAIGSPDDPELNLTSIRFAIFSAAQGAGDVTTPHRTDDPDWTVKVSRRADSYKYRNSSPALFEISDVTFVEGKRLRIRAPLIFPAGARFEKVAVLVVTGSLRSCALFDVESIRRDDGRFLGKNAPAPALVDCSDATLKAAISPGCSTSWPTCDATCSDGGVCVSESDRCRCVHPTQPCGGSSPICGGGCRRGEECYPIDGFIVGSINSCACAPTGQPPCGTSGLGCDAGGCPEGLECQLLPAINPNHDAFCSCIDPEQACGGSQFGTCPPDFRCERFPPSSEGGPFACVPNVTPCGGGYPTCGGACMDGKSCVPVLADGTGVCVCATPGFSCDGLTCGGLTCPSGEVCAVTGTVSGPLGCSCEPL